MKKKLLLTNVGLYIYLYHISLLFAAVYFGVLYAGNKDFLKAAAFTLEHFFYPPAFLILLIFSVIMLRNRDSTEPRDCWILGGILLVLVGIAALHIRRTVEILPLFHLSWLRWAPISILVCTIVASILYFLCALLIHREDKRLEQKFHSRHQYTLDSNTQ